MNALMKRLLRVTLLTAALLLSGGCKDDSAATAPTAGADTEDGAMQNFRWRMVTTWPVGMPIFQDAAQKFADDVRRMSKGRLDIHVHAAGELVPALQVFDAVSQGLVELGHGSAYYWAGKVPAAQFFSAVPFGVNAAEMRDWLHSGGLELWHRIYEPFGVRPLPMGNTGMQMGGWFNRPIESLKDIEGLRMRIPGLGGKVLERAGGNPVLMAGGEIYTALERGVIDATEWVGPFHDMRLGLQRAAKYYYYPGWHERGTEFELLVGTAVWATLPADLQVIIEAAAASTGTWVLARMREENRKALAQLRRMQHVQIRSFPPEVLARLRALTTQTLEEEAAADPLFAEVHASYENFRAGLQDWKSLTEDALPEPAAP